ncbi:phospholipase D-like domain-containing protein [Mangrovibacterium sp.]|uniref:phospholipase D-like domain-containing protein n=1 Tax=Mangrovibacterium sp. TaxID=1961364 RepID=UPI003569ADD1
MQKVIQYLKDQYGKAYSTANGVEIASEIQQLSLSDRKELKSRLFHEARILEQKNHDGQSIAWLEYCLALLEEHTFRFHKVYFSPGNDILEVMGDLIDQSKSTIDLCVFTITDSRLTNKILQAMKRNVKIRLITDDRKIFDRGSEGFALRNAGIPVKIDHSQYHMHHKFGIIDQRFAFTGSFNWTYTASKHNNENLLITSKYALIEQYQEEFDRLWKEMFDL